MHLSRNVYSVGFSIPGSSEQLRINWLGVWGQAPRTPLKSLPLVGLQEQLVA
jgi:hypothetical protein